MRLLVLSSLLFVAPLAGGQTPPSACPVPVECSQVYFPEETPGLLGALEPFGAEYMAPSLAGEGTHYQVRIPPDSFQCGSLELEAAEIASVSMWTGANTFADILRLEVRMGPAMSAALSSNLELNLTPGNATLALSRLTPMTVLGGSGASDAWYTLELDSPVHYDRQAMPHGVILDIRADLGQTNLLVGAAIGQPFAHGAMTYLPGSWGCCNIWSSTGIGLVESGPAMQVRLGLLANYQVNQPTAYLDLSAIFGQSGVAGTGAVPATLCLPPSTPFWLTAATAPSSNPLWLLWRFQDPSSTVPSFISRAQGAMVIPDPDVILNINLFPLASLQVWPWSPGTVVVVTPPLATSLYAQVASFTGAVQPWNLSQPVVLHVQ